jgi:hypothetical protein
VNTPPKPKPPIRFDVDRLVVRLPEGTIYTGVKNDEIAMLLGRIAGQWTHVEEAMSRLLALILDSDDDMAARHIFRSIVNQHARITVMRNLLEKCLPAVGLDQTVDEKINEFEALNGCRNRYVHGVWMTDTDTGKVYLAEADVTHFVYLPSRRVTPNELVDVACRMEQLERGTHSYINDFRVRRAQKRH